MLANYVIYTFLMNKKIKILSKHKKMYSKIVRSIKNCNNDSIINNYNPILLEFNTNNNLLSSANTKNIITVPELFTSKNIVSNYLTHTVFTEKIIV